MRKYKIILSFVAVLFIFQNCKKEDQILKKLVGTWDITEYNRAGGYVKSDFSSDATTFEFIPHKRAYTSTLRAVYKIDYSDPSKQDFIDTFRFELKKNELDISYVQHNQPLAKEVKFLYSKRFKIEEYKSNKLKLSRVDSTDLYIKATK